MPEGYAIQAIQAVLSGQRAYCKFLAANDTGLTGGHQAGIYISKPSIPILFDEPGIKGTNKEKWVKVKWQDGIETDTRFIYYGKGTRTSIGLQTSGAVFLSRDRSIQGRFLYLQNVMLRIIRHLY